MMKLDHCHLIDTHTVGLGKGFCYISVDPIPITAFLLTLLITQALHVLSTVLLFSSGLTLGILLLPLHTFSFPPLHNAINGSVMVVFLDLLKSLVDVGRYQIVNIVNTCSAAIPL